MVSASNAVCASLCVFAYVGVCGRLYSLLVRAAFVASAYRNLSQLSLDISIQDQKLKGIEPSQD